jgi:RNA polymerase sigma-70 factor (ECF subfamily)
LTAAQFIRTPFSWNAAVQFTAEIGGQRLTLAEACQEVVTLAIGRAMTADSHRELAWTPKVVDGGAALPADWVDIQSSLGGDGQAFARLVHRYQDQIAAQMWRLSRQHADCEQLVHDVFVEAYLSLRKYQGRAPFLHWLRKIATRVGYRYWKQQAKQRQQSATPLQDWHKCTEPAPAGQTSEEAASLVHSLLAKLPPRDRLVLTLIYLEGCSVAEAAEMSGWSQTMVKVQAHRARKKLKKLLDEAS